MRRALPWLSICALLLAHAGCGDGAKNTASSINELRAGIYRAICDRSARCGVIGKSEVQRCYDDYTVLTDGPVDYTSMVTSGAILFDAAAAGRCLDALDALPCNVFEELPPDCDTAARGTVPPGAACIIDLVCKDGYCTANKDGCAGTCKAFTAAGATCSSDAECGPDAVCVGSPRACLAAIARGATCGGVAPCSRGLACLPSMSGPPTCGTPASVGAPCLDDLSCAAGLYCDAAKKLCAARVGTGATCTTPFQCQDGQTCLGYSGPGSSGTCGPWLDANAACASSPLGCPRDMACDANKRTCAPRPGPGQPCTGNGTCRSGTYCDTTSHNCEPLVSYGGACTPQGGGDDPCAIGVCESTTRKCLVLCP